MKILFAIKSIGARGGAERVLAEVASGMAERGHDVTLLTFDQPDTLAAYSLHASIRRRDITIGRADQPTTYADTLGRIPALRSAVCAVAPDVAVGFMHSMFIPLGFALIGTNIPLIGSEHIVGSHYSDKPMQRFLLGLAPALVRRITVVSEQARASFPRSLQRRMVVVENPVSITVTKKADVVGDVQARRVLLSVGRLCAQKDHKVLIDAFARIAPRFPDWDLRIIGEGELRADLEAQIEALGLRDRVQLAGATDEISKEYAGAQLCVLPSRYESFGLVAAEALAHGLPTVAFADCAGLNQLIRDGENGVLVSSGRDRGGALAEALGSLMEDP